MRRLHQNARVDNPSGQSTLSVSQDLISNSCNMYKQIICVEISREKSFTNMFGFLAVGESLLHDILNWYVLIILTSLNLVTNIVSVHDVTDMISPIE